MSRIDETTEKKIKDAASIVDVVGSFVGLRRSGKDLEGYCPFHDDKHLGNFIVSPAKNVASCFACGWHGGPIDFLMKHLNINYGEALRWLAERYGIPTESDVSYTAASRPTAIFKPREPLPELPLITFSKDIVTKRMCQDGNTLIEWLKSLRWSDDNRQVLDTMLQCYLVGTSNQGATKGWTIWWYVDDQNRVRTGKMMKYLPNGHRDKSPGPDGRKGYSTDWIHTKLKKVGIWNDETHRVESCLFGLHLVDVFDEAEVCIVESEKTAVIAQTIANPKEKLFMATGAKGQLNRRMLQPLIERDRWIILYPDMDGYDDWTAKVKEIGYDKIQVSRRVHDLYVPGVDDPKSDIADIIVRRLEPTKETDSQKAHRLLGLTTENKSLTNLINKFELIPNGECI